MQVMLRLDGKRLYAVALHLIVIALGVEVFILARENEELKENQDFLVVGRLKVGDWFSVDGLTAVTPAAGHASEVKGKQLIFVFSTNCKFCKANIKPWQDIALRATVHNLRTYAVSMDSLSRTKSYIAKNGIIGYDVYVPLDIRGFAKKNRLAGVPLTVLRSALGNVEGVWIGSLEGKHIGEIIDRFSSK